MAISVTDWIRKQLEKNGYDKEAIYNEQFWQKMKDEGVSSMRFESYKRKVREVHQSYSEQGGAETVDIKSKYPDWNEDTIYALLESETEKKGRMLKNPDLRKIADDNGFPVPLYQAYFEYPHEIVKSIHKNLGLGVSEKKQVQKLKDKIKILEAENKKLIKNEVGHEQVLEVLDTIVENYKPFSKPIIFKNKKSKTLKGCAILSDWHVDESVYLDQMHGINEYNVEIAKERIHKTFDNIIENGKIFQLNSIHLDIIGDMISGNLHDLAENSEGHVMEQIIMVADFTAQQIQRLSGHYKDITCIGIAGNHSRIHKKPYMKHKNTMNFEYLMYEFIRRETKNCVSDFYIPESPFLVHNVNGTDILSLHGDQMRGGSGLNSVPGNMSRDISLLDGVLSSVGKPFQVVNVAHFHSFNVVKSFSGARIIMNGSLIGGNEFSINAIKKSEEPSQTFYVLDKEEKGKPKYIEAMTV